MARCIAFTDTSSLATRSIFPPNLPSLAFAITNPYAPSYPWVKSNARTLRLSSLSYIPSKFANPLPRRPVLTTPDRNFDQHNLSYEQWRSVLHLSSRWGFASLRKLALRSVKPPTACDRLLLARTYGVDNWVLPALSALCERTVPISLVEARQMSIEDVVLVATVREDICNHGSRAEVPLLIETTQARIAHAAGDDIPPASSNNKASEKDPDSTEVVAAGPGPEGGSDSGSKTVATAPSVEDDKREDDEHSVSPSTALSMGCK